MTSKTIALSGAEIRVDYSGGTNAWLRNDGTDVIYASADRTARDRRGARSA